MQPDDINALAENLSSEIHAVPGHLTDREARHLAMLTAFAKGDGDLLEIGSFMGKSTVLLSLAAGRAQGNPRIVAVDPLTQPAETDPGVEGNLPSRDTFYANLIKAGVEKDVEFHEMLSGDLAQQWSRPLRMLWIDGDHTYEGVLSDFENFAPHLIPGGIIAMHDVMHGFIGPDRVFLEKILASDNFGATGIVGSVGWAQKGHPTAKQQRHKSHLSEGLQNWLDSLPSSGEIRVLRKLLLKFKRSRVPHGAIDATELMRQLN